MLGAARNADLAADGLCRRAVAVATTVGCVELDWLPADETISGQIPAKTKAIVAILRCS